MAWGLNNVVTSGGRRQRRTVDFFAAAFGFSEGGGGYEENRRRLLEMATFESLPGGGPHLRERCVFTRPDGGGGATTTLTAGVFSMPTVRQLRERVAEMLEAAAAATAGDDAAAASPAAKAAGAARTRVQNVVGEARSLHSSVPASNADAAGAGAVVFQAASQFNMLEFASPGATPETGITGYVSDRTQGPACAIACAAGTAYRNYLVPVAMMMEDGNERRHDHGGDDDHHHRGQNRTRQLNGLADIEAYLASECGVSSPWTVKNGYVESSAERINAVNELLLLSSSGNGGGGAGGGGGGGGSNPPQPLREELASLLRIGVQEDTAVTDVPSPVGATVTQTYNSAVSIGYSSLPDHLWEPMARVILNGTYEATLLVGILKSLEDSSTRREEGGASSSNTAPIYLTKVGGGVFQNKDEWIVQAIARAIERAKGYGVDLDIKIVHYGRVESAYRVLEEDFSS